MSKVVLWERDDGTVVARTPTAGLSLAAFIASDDAPKDRPYFVVDAASLPPDPAPLWRLAPDGKVNVVPDPEEYRQKRAKEYPPIQDQLDAIWKNGADLADMRATIAAIKAKHPKPERSKDLPGVLT